MGKLRNAGKFYTGIMMKNIGIFIFVGILSVVFHDHGWIPNRDMYAISQLVYSVVVPTMVAYESGKTIGGSNGGALAVVAVSGVVLSGLQMGLLAAMMVGPLCGFLWKRLEGALEKYAASSLQMLIRNLCIGIVGGIFAMSGHYLLVPVLEFVASKIFQGINFFAAHHMTAALSILIEPAKIFFLNNIMNHTVMVPLGMSQVQQEGSSIFFLLESNPGPGIGILLALYIADKGRRKEYATALFAHGIGGIHEVYFPFALSDLRLLVPLILGGMAGGYCFGLLDAGVQGVVSPGSVILILLMAGKDTWLPVLTGILVSALVSFTGGMVILQKGRRERKSEREKVEKKEEGAAMKISKIGFVCDAGVGSSAMGAALLRRMFIKENISDVQVTAYASDMMPEDLNLIVCLKDFRKMLPEGAEGKEIVTVDNLVSSAEFSKIIRLIQDRNR